MFSSCHFFKDIKHMILLYDRNNMVYVSSYIISFLYSKTSSQLLIEVNSSVILLQPIFLESSATVQQHVFYVLIRVKLEMLDFSQGGLS